MWWNFRPLQGPYCPLCATTRFRLENTVRGFLWNGTVNSIWSFLKNHDFHLRIESLLQPAIYHNTVVMYIILSGISLGWFISCPYQVNPFYGRMVEAVRSCRSRLATDRRMAGVDDEDAYQVPTESLEVVEEPIVLEVYLGWSAALHNTSQLGFLKNRGFINF